MRHLKPAETKAGKHLKSSKRRSINNFLQVAGILPILLLICILFALLSPNFLSAGNAINILRQASINIVLATGMTFVIRY